MKSTRSTPAWAADYTIGPGDQLGIEVWFLLVLFIPELT